MCRQFLAGKGVVYLLGVRVYAVRTCWRTAPRNGIVYTQVAQFLDHSGSSQEPSCGFRGYLGGLGGAFFEVLGGCLGGPAGPKNERLA